MSEFVQEKYSMIDIHRFHRPGMQEAVRTVESRVAYRQELILNML